MPKPEVAILDLEERLDKDFEGTQSEVLAQLQTLRQEIKSELDKGLAPDEYAPGAAVLEAVDRSMEVMRQLRP